MSYIFSLWMESFWLFLPALTANQCPGFVAYVARKWWMPFHFPVSDRWLGGSKTWSAYYAGPIGGILTLSLQRSEWDLPVILLGFCMGFGAVSGDHVESFVKRRLGLLSGKAFWPWDQIDFAIGAILLSSFLIVWKIESVTIILLSMLIIHPIGNFIGMKLGLRKTWW